MDYSQKPWREEHDVQIQFFSSLESWRIGCRLLHPQSIERTEDGVYRSYLNNIKMGVFNNLPGHGYVTTNTGSKIINKSMQGSPSYKRKMGIARRASRVRKKNRILLSPSAKIRKRAREAALRRWARKKAEV